MTTTLPIARRRLLAGAGAGLVLAGLPGCGTLPLGGATPAPGERLTLTPLRVGPERISAITVCTRPFRPEGPRLERVRMGETDVIHNYGHGGSGWSLSWGTAAVATEMALETGARDVAVLGCGAIGLTTALTLVRAGARVTIYAKELPPDVSSALASGIWSPDSRICLEPHATPAFKALWARMTRHSFATCQGLLGIPGAPVEWIDTHFIRGEAGPEGYEPVTDRPRFANLRREMTPELSLGSREYAPGAHPFGDWRVRRSAVMIYNLVPYFRMLLADYLALGGRIEVREFHTPADVLALKQRTIVNCTGYGAKALFGDASLVPVRGQIARTPPQPEIGYGLFHKQVSFLPRRDGLMFQYVGPNDYYGYGDEGLSPDRDEAVRAVETIAGLFAA